VLAISARNLFVRKLQGGGVRFAGRFFKLETCINRHDAAINGVFLDFSIREIGLKELWKLRWHRSFDINGPWTKAGGVTPDD